MPRQANASSRDNNRLPFRFRNLAAIGVPARDPPSTKTSFFVTDVDLDGNDDLLVEGPDRLLWYRLRENGATLVREGVYGAPGSTRFVGDVNGDGRPEFFVCTEASKRSMLSCYDWFSPAEPSVPLYTIGPLLPPQKIDELNARNKINFLGCFGAERGVPATVFIGVNPLRYEKLLRSLVAYDAATGRKRWDFHFAPMSTALDCSAFGADVPRVLLTTAAVSNGVSHDGMSDDHSYLFCLDGRDGHIIWKKEVTGSSGRSYPAIADLDCDGRNEVLLARFLAKNDSIFSKEKAPWMVAAMNGDGAILSTVSLPSPARSIQTADLDGDRYPEILVCGNDGEMVILNHDLTIRRIENPFKDLSSPKLKVIGVRDLTDDGASEIICSLDEDLLVRDRDGVLLAERLFSFLVDALPVRFNGKNYIAAASKDSIHIMMLERTPVAARVLGYWRPLAIGAGIASIIAGWTVFHGRRMLKKRRERKLSSYEAQSELLTAMAAFGHGGSSLKIIDRIRLHLKNWERVQADSAGRGALIAKLHETLMETVSPELEHIVMLARKAGVAEEIWSPIGARTEAAGKEMEAILAESPGESPAFRSEHVVSALKALDDCDELIAGIRTYLRSVFRAPVTEALERGVARFRDEHVDTKISLSLPPDAPAAAGVFISPVVFDKILEALLTNSAQATEGRADAEISIDVRWEGNYCTIDIRDNGCGISREDRERVFERSFTTKEEGGFGLYYAHEMLAKVNGKIFVLDSVVGVGTTMRVVLRKS